MIRQLLLASTCLSILAACGKHDPGETPTPSPDSVAGWPATLSSDGGSYEVTLSPTGGAPIVRNKHFSLDLSVAVKDGESEGLKVVVDADMPAHQHGMNTKPELTTPSATGYHVDGMLFHMGGDWVITVDVTRADKTERVSFPVSVE
jgi:hypothetical protein